MRWKHANFVMACLGSKCCRGEISADRYELWKDELLRSLPHEHTYGELLPAPYDNYRPALTFCPRCIVDDLGLQRGACRMIWLKLRCWWEDLWR
jgi:DNA-directed RNA polymerase subunit N (RpoN/RPB10)